MTPELDSTLIKLANIAAVLAAAYILRIAFELVLDAIDFLRGPQQSCGHSTPVFAVISQHPTEGDDPEAPGEGPNKNPDGWKN